MMDQTRNGQGVKLSIVVSHPIQYMCHTYRRLALEPDIRVTVHFSSLMGAVEYFDSGMGRRLKWESQLLSGFTWTTADHGPLARRGSFMRRAWSTLRRLGKADPDVVLLHGYSTPECLAAWSWASAKKRRLVLFGDGNGRIEAARPHARRALKRWILRPMLRRFDSVLSLGEANEGYWKLLGLQTERVVHAPQYLPDPAIFMMDRDVRLEMRKSVRAELGIPDGDFVALYVGKFQRRKRVHDLVDAVDRVSGIRCLYIGDGETRTACERRSCSPDRHHFLGFANLGRLPGIYAAADALVHPAECEPYGLVVAEAASVGMPVVCTAQTGAIGEGSHGQPGRNATLFEVGDVDGLASILCHLSRHPETRKSMALASRAVASEVHDAGLRGLRVAIGLAPDCTGKLSGVGDASTGEPSCA